MYSNKYPGPGPVPPLLDNNLAINTAQGRVVPGQAAPMQPSPPGSPTIPALRRPQGTPTSPWLQAWAGQAGCDRLCLDHPLGARRAAELDTLGSPCPVALRCQERAFCTHSRLVKGFRD